MPPVLITNILVKITKWEWVTYEIWAVCLFHKDTQNIGTYIHILQHTKASVCGFECDNTHTQISIRSRCCMKKKKLKNSRCLLIRRSEQMSKMEKRVSWESAVQCLPWYYVIRQNDVNTTTFSSVHIWKCVKIWNTIRIR